MSLKSRLLSYLQRNSNRSIPSGELQRLAMEAGYSAQNAGRRLRELENENRVLVSYGNKNAASYQYRPTTSFSQFPPLETSPDKPHIKLNQEIGKDIDFTPAPVCPPEQAKLI